MNFSGSQELGIVLLSAWLVVVVLVYSTMWYRAARRYRRRKAVQDDVARFNDLSRESHDRAIFERIARAREEGR